MQIWFSNRPFWGLQKFHSDGKRSKVDDMVIFVSKKTVPPRSLRLMLSLLFSTGLFKPCL